MSIALSERARERVDLFHDDQSGCILLMCISDAVLIRLAHVIIINVAY